jgi:D-arabinose 5-phosphate isomerase GutQ
MGTKNSVMGKTLAAMTDEQTSSMISSAEVALQKQAKKSLRDNALKVQNLLQLYFTINIM